MQTIKQAYTINTSPERVFEALTSVKDIEAWSGAGGIFIWARSKNISKRNRRHAAFYQV